MTINIKEQVEDFLTSLLKGDKEAANNSIENLLMDKVSTRLEDMKIDVAQKHFNIATEESVEDIDEGYDDNINDPANTRGLGGPIKLGGKPHGTGQNLPIKYHNEFKEKYTGKVIFKGRDENRKLDHTRANATHFEIVHARLREDNNEQVEDIDEASRKDYVETARIVAQIPDEKTRQAVANAHASSYANDNPKFDHSIFHAASNTHYISSPPLEAEVKGKTDAQIRIDRNRAKDARSFVKTLANIHKT